MQDSFLLPSFLVCWLQNGGFPAFNQLFQRAVETQQSDEEAAFLLDEAAQQEAAVTTLINNKAELHLDTVMQDNMKLQEGSRDALKVSGMGVVLVLFVRLQAYTRTIAIMEALTYSTLLQMIRQQQLQIQAHDKWRAHRVDELAQLKHEVSKLKLEVEQRDAMVSNLKRKVEDVDVDRRNVKQKLQSLAEQIVI